MIIRHQQPFKRANALAAQVQEIMIGTAGFPLLMQMMIQALGSYESRGKGGRHKAQCAGTRCVAWDKRDARKARNRARSKR